MHEFEIRDQFLEFQEFGSNEFQGLGFLIRTINLHWLEFLAILMKLEEPSWKLRNC